MSSIKITFPDNSVKEFDAGVTTAEIAKSISISLAKKAVAGKVDGNFVDLNQPLKEDGSIEIITKDSNDGLVVLWRTAAQVLANALHELYPNMKFGLGDVTEHGFYFDTDNSEGQVAETDFEKISQKMSEIIKSNLPIERVEFSEDEALNLVSGDEYQEELVRDVANKNNGKVVAYKQGDFIDITDGVVLSSTGEVKIFKLLSVAGAYWKGASSNPMLQRIYGTAFYKQKDLDAELQRQKEARERDHPALKQVERLQEAGNVKAFIDDDVLYVKDSDKALSGRLRILSQKSGMVGIPKATEKGVDVTYLIDGESSLGGMLRLDSKYNPALNGDYIIEQLKFDIASHDDPFFYQATCKRA